MPYLSENGPDRIRRIMLMFAVVGLCIVLLVFPLMSHRMAIDFAIMGIAAAGNVTVIAMCLLRYRITPAASSAYLTLSAALFIYLDLRRRTLTRSSIWPVFLLLINGSLVLQLSRRFIASLFCVLLAWVALATAETSLRFGLFDIPALTLPNDIRLDILQERCGCTHPPCGLRLNIAAADFTVAVVVLALATITVRGFAASAQSEREAMQRTIETVEAIAELLAGFDIDTVDCRLDQAKGQLPGPTYAALRCLSGNLRSYRPYLPAALFERRGDDAPQSSPAEAPGVVSNRATIAFTDIRGSTTLWEADPEAMKKAMRVHNTVVRTALAAHRGYEVKTIGDAFMVAFSNCCDAVAFALAVQESLLRAEWPEAILDIPLCRTTPLWGGLTVRIGINHGEVMVEANDLTGRVDYFGSVVNAAARLESVCPPGAIALPAQLWEDLGGLCPPSTVSEEMSQVLTGISTTARIRHMWPPRLAARRVRPLRSCEGGGAASLLSSPRSVHVGSAPDPLLQTAPSATVGALALGVVDQPSGAELINQGLEAIVPLMEQSGGTLVTLLGEQIWVEWNVRRTTCAHIESSIRFSRRALGICLPLSGIGLVSGVVSHGDVGTARQRFTTTVGVPVAYSTRLCQLALDSGVQCLYGVAGEGGEGDGDGLGGDGEGVIPKPSALHRMLRTTGVLSAAPARLQMVPACAEGVRELYIVNSVANAQQQLDGGSLFP